MSTYSSSLLSLYYYSHLPPSFPRVLPRGLGPSVGLASEVCVFAGRGLFHNPFLPALAMLMMLTILSRVRGVSPMARGMASMAAMPDWPIITSPSNARFKLIKRLHARRHREKLNLILVEGHRLVLDALDAGLQPEFVVIHDAALSSSTRGERLATALARLDADRVVRAPPQLFGQLSDTLTPQGVLAVLNHRSTPLPKAPSLVLVCDAVSDPGNLGTLLRSAAGSGVDAVLLTPGSSDPWGLKALRSGMGAQFRVPLHSVSSWADAAAILADWGCTALAADAAGERAHDEVDWCQAAALIVGSEAHGLSDDVRADPTVKLCRIPLGAADGDAVGVDGLESLNAAVAGSVMLFEAQRQRRVRASQP